MHEAGSAEYEVSETKIVAELCTPQPYEQPSMKCIHTICFAS
jgi:hypothetical protein